MLLSKFILAFLTSLALATVPLAAQAATQGSLGSTSQGIVNISITKSVQAMITDLSDTNMTLANWSLDQGAVTLYSNACVYSSTGNYKVTATGSGIAGLFTIASGANLLPYSVTWNAGGAGNLANTGSTLLPLVQSTGFTTATSTSTSCNGGGSANDTARVVVGVTDAAMVAAASSNTAYTGTLTLLISPY